MGDLKEDFPLLFQDNNPVTYLDNAGAALYTRSQIEAAASDLKNNLVCNPHTNYGAITGVPDVNGLIKEARQQVLRFFHVTSNDYSVIFTSGATEALKMAAMDFRWPSIKRFAYLDHCHTSVVGIREMVNDFKVVKEVDVLDMLEQDQYGGLFCFPAMSNFCGRKFPMAKWIQTAQDCNWKVLLDAASFVSTNPLNLTEVKPDFVAISFYKIFGYPTGLGALLVKNESLNLLEKQYFGGGSVEMHLVKSRGHAQKPTEDNFEDGTINFMAIIALKHGFEVIEKYGGMSLISDRVFALAQHLYKELSSLKYENGLSAVKIYSATDFTDKSCQGGIVNFNIVDRSGQIFGFTEFRKMALHNNLVIRVGCFCNLGGCQSYLGLEDEDIKRNHEAGHVCGDNIDVIDGKPTGSIRISFGYYNRETDANQVVNIIRSHLINNPEIRARSTTVSEKAKVSALYVYPIKSCAALKITQGLWPLAEGSLLYDRQFVIMQGKSCVTQKNQPLLCQVRPEIDLANQTMTLSVPWEGSKVKIDICKAGTFNKTENQEVCIGKVCGDTIEGGDCGDEVSEWLENILGLTGLRLVQLEKRSSKKPESGLKSLANEAQFLVLNRASAANLVEKNKHNIDGCSADDIDPDILNVDWMLEQFRGNLVIDAGNAFEEDNWNTITIGHNGTNGNNGLDLDVIGPCTRCNIIGINQVNSERVQEPLDSLARMENRRFKFGVLAGSATSMTGKSIKIGETVTFQRKSI